MMMMMMMRCIFLGVSGKGGGGAGSSWSCIVTLLFHNKCLSYLPHSISFPNTASHAKILHRQQILENPTCQILVNSRCLILNSQFPIPFLKYTFFCFILLFTSSLPCSKDHFAMSYISTSLIVLIQVYNWEIQHHSLVCCCGLADIFFLSVPISCQEISHSVFWPNPRSQKYPSRLCLDS